MFFAKGLRVFHLNCIKNVAQVTPQTSCKSTRHAHTSAMPVRCLDGEVTDLELAEWNATVVRERVPLTREQVVSVFVGTPLSRGLAMCALTRSQFVKLFPTRSVQKNALTLRRWALKIQTPKAQKALLHATWRQLRAAAMHDKEDAQIGAAIEHALGVHKSTKRATGQPLARWQRWRPRLREERGSQNWPR